MIAQARAELPNECCGLLAGQITDGVGLVVERYPLVNAMAGVTPLMREFLGWIASRRRTHAETMEAWRSNCPRQAVWDDALVAGFVQLENGDSVQEVTLTPRGQALLAGVLGEVEYESDSRSMFEAERSRRNSGLEFLAIYHSHPTSDPIPSKKDLARSYSDDVVNLIISLKAEPPSVRGWWLTAKDFREANWECVS